MKNPKKILILNYEFPPLGGGGGVASYKLAKGFVDLGYEVDCLTSWFEGLKKFEVMDGITVHRVKVLGRKDPNTATMPSLVSFPVLALKKGGELCRKNKYEFINTHFAVPTGPLGAWLSRKFKIKHILSLHGGDIYDPSKNNSPHTKWYFRTAVNWVLNNSDFLVAQSSDTRKNTLRFYKAPKEIKIIPLAYESFVFKKVSRKEIDLEDGLFYTVSIGRLVKRKGFDFLIKSIAEVDKKVHALIIGEGPEKKFLENLVITLNLKERVHFLGSVTDERKFQYLSNADVYVLSSMHEGFGIVLQEAMQVGLPIISTNNGGQVDFVKENKNGFLINFGDVKTLNQRIDDLMENPDLKNRFSNFNKEAGKKFETGEICRKD